ncbi:MAG: ammonium transporter [Gammaproteobacteria bacterium]|nr:ammonium transporter [Gammaproteobacteria bacterium]
MRIGFGHAVTGAGVLLAWPVAAAADSGDTAWMLTATALVLFMTLPGLALFYAGLVRARNVLSVLMQCFTIASVVSIFWVLVGYSLAFGDGGAGHAVIGGFGRVLLAGLDAGAVHAAYPNIPESVFLMFQMTFAIITPALVVGAFAERMRFGAMLLFSVLWLLLVYIPVAHWVWGGGWLASLGFRDFAGGAVVHINAGIAALVAALVLGSRRGFPMQPMPPHNLPTTVAGAGMLWVGWFGFNAGSAVAADGAAGMAMLATHTAAAAGCFAWICQEWLKFGKPSVLGIVTGMVAGLGTITPASGYVGPGGALAIGLLAGTVCFWATQYVKRRLQIDDSLDVFPVHGVGGFMGTVLTGVFGAAALGGIDPADGRLLIVQLGIQFLGATATLAWSAGVTFIILKLVAALTPLRVTAEEETEGLDIALHEERGYNL